MIEFPNKLASFVVWCVDNKFYSIPLILSLLISSIFGIDYAHRKLEQYGIRIDKAVTIENGVATIDTRVFDSDITVSELASALGVGSEDIRTLNPDLAWLQNNAPLRANGVTSIRVPAPKLPVDYENISDNVPMPTPWPEFTPTPAEGETLYGINSQNSDGTPTEETYGVYVVKAGDNLFRIALNHGITLKQLLDANGIPQDSLIHPGDSLVIPPSQK